MRSERRERKRRGSGVGRFGGFPARCASFTATYSACKPRGVTGERAPKTEAPRGGARAFAPQATTSPLTSRPRTRGSVGRNSAAP